MHCSNMGGTDVEGLRHDLRNTIFHVFGVHDGCRSYFCRNDEPSSNGPIQILRSDNHVYNSALNLLENLAADADRLRYGLSTNIAENFMGTITKFNLGKRENLCGRGSYSLRVLIAICLRNEGYSWAREAYPKFSGGSANPQYLKYAAKRERQKQYTEKSVSRESYKKGCTKKLLVERSYGNCVPDNTELEAAVPALLHEYEVFFYF